MVDIYISPITGEDNYLKEKLLIIIVLKATRKTTKSCYRGPDKTAELSALCTGSSCTTVRVKPFWLRFGVHRHPDRSMPG